MYFKISNGVAKKAFILSCLFGSLQPSLAAEITESSQHQTNKKSSLTSVNFSAQPANCIALRHGRTCYANVTLSWFSPVKQDYCVYVKQVKTKSTQQKMVQCWKNSSGNQTIFNFESNKKVEFQLISLKDNKVIAETAVEVNWVHKAAPRKRRWRIF